MNNPGIIPLLTDSVWQNSGGVANLKDIISNVDISKVTTFSSLGNRILGDMSNATISNRLLFQTSAIDSYTSFGLIPNGIHDTSSISLFNSSNPDNASNGYFSIDSSSLNIQSGKAGLGSYLPINFNTGGTTRLTLDTDGLLFIENISNYPVVTTNKVYASGGDLYWGITKLNGVSSGGSQTLSQTLTLGNSASGLQIINLADPTLPQDATTKIYVDTLTKNTSGNVLSLANTYADVASSNIINYINYSLGSIQTSTPALSAILSIGNDANLNNIKNLLDPVDFQDAVTKYYVDTLVSATSGQGSSPSTISTLSQILSAGNSAGSSQIDMNSNKIINVVNPTDPQDVATKYYVDTTVIPSSGGGSGGPRWSFVLGGM